MQCNMKLTGIVFAILMTQVSASFFDVFQGAVLSVQNSFGKLLSDVVTDVKETVDCTILAVEHVFALNDPANDHYYEKCKNSSAPEQKPPIEVTPPPKVDTTVEVFKETEYLKKNISEEIEAKINETLSRMLSKYDVRDKIENVEEILAKESDRLADVSSMVKQELDKLSSEVTSDLRKIEEKDDKPTVESVLEKINLLQDRERAASNSSEAKEIHKVVNKVLDKLDVIEATEASENIKLEEILKDLETNSNDSFVELDKKFEVWKEEKSNYLEEIKNRMEEENEISRHSLANDGANRIYSEKDNLIDDNKMQNNSTPKLSATEAIPTPVTESNINPLVLNSSTTIEPTTILIPSESLNITTDSFILTDPSRILDPNYAALNATSPEPFPNTTTSNNSPIEMGIESSTQEIPHDSTLQSENKSLVINSTTEYYNVSTSNGTKLEPSVVISPTSFFYSASSAASLDFSTGPATSEHTTTTSKSEPSVIQTTLKSFTESSTFQTDTTTFTTDSNLYNLTSLTPSPSQPSFISSIPKFASSKAISGSTNIPLVAPITSGPLSSLFKSTTLQYVVVPTPIVSQPPNVTLPSKPTNSFPILTNITNPSVVSDIDVYPNQSIAEGNLNNSVTENTYRPTLQNESIASFILDRNGTISKRNKEEFILRANATETLTEAPLIKWAENRQNQSLIKFVELNDRPLVDEDLDPVPTTSVRASDMSKSSTVAVGEKSIVLTTNKPIASSTPNTKHMDEKLSVDYEAFLKKVTNSAHHKKAVKDAKRLIEDSKKTDLIIHHILKNRKSARSVFNNYPVSTNFR